MTERPDDYWRQALLPSDATVHDAIRNLDASALRIAMVISPDGVLIGTITDGDIRRGLLRGLNLNSSIDTLVPLWRNRSPAAWYLCQTPADVPSL